MDEYIKRAEALEITTRTCGDYAAAWSEIRKLPAADAVEVVRCRDCQRWKPSGSKAGKSFSDMEYIGGCEFSKYCRRESDFCSYGETKET